jgi:hypothetical protein
MLSGPILANVERVSHFFVLFLEAGNVRLFTLLGFVAAVSVPSLVQAAEPADPMQAAVFAGGNLTFNAFDAVTGGPVVANGNVLHNGGSLDVPSIYAGGTFTDTRASFQNTSGEILFGGDITNLGGPGSIFGGNITSGGSIAFLTANETINGNVTARNNVALTFAFSTINGNVLAGGDVSLIGTVVGNVTYGGNYTLSGFGQVTGTTTHGGAVTPTPYVPLTLPAGRALAPGASDVTLGNSETRSLAPGAYGAVTFGAGDTLQLSAGQYIFSSISNGFAFNNLSFDTSGGPINIFVAGDWDFKLGQVINGQPLSGGAPNPLDSTGIFLEVGGNFTADASLYGTVFAPNGNITLDSFASVTGRVLAGHDVTINTGSVTVVPEPASAAVLLAGACWVLTRGRRRG